MSNGNYETRCTAILRGAAFGWSEYEGRQQPQLVGRFEILDGDDQGKFETWFGSLSEDENTKGRPFWEFTRDALRTCGWTGDDFSEVPGLIAEGKLANEVAIVREHRQKDGKWRSSVKYVNSPGGANVDLKDKAMSPSEIADFAKRMKAKMGGARASNGNGHPGPGVDWKRRAAETAEANAARQAASQRQQSLQASGGYGGSRGRVEQDVPPPSDDDIPF